MQRRRDVQDWLPWAAVRLKLRQARQMRRHATLAEAHLWSRLRDRQVEGVKFRRQHIIAGWIVDFYCPALRLAVEVDGPHHASQRDKDERRTRILGAHGVRVVRVSAQAVMDQVDDVVESLRAVIVACKRDN